MSDMTRTQAIEFFSEFFHGKHHIPPAGVHEWGGGYISQRVGKLCAGRLLDGVEHNEFPGVLP